MKGCYTGCVGEKCVPDAAYVMAVQLGRAEGCYDKDMVSKADVARKLAVIGRRCPLRCAVGASDEQCVRAGMAHIAGNADLVARNSPPLVALPAFAQARVDMPVIDGEADLQAGRPLNAALAAGRVDWSPPYFAGPPGRPAGLGDSEAGGDSETGVADGARESNLGAD